MTVCWRTWRAASFGAGRDRVLLPELPFKLLLKRPGLPRLLTRHNVAGALLE